jgi:hypothetical protein
MKSEGKTIYLSTVICTWRILPTNEPHCIGCTSRWNKGWWCKKPTYNLDLLLKLTSGWQSRVEHNRSTKTLRMLPQVHSEKRWWFAIKLRAAPSNAQWSTAMSDQKAAGGRHLVKSKEFTGFVKRGIYLVSCQPVCSTPLYYCRTRSKYSSQSPLHTANLHWRTLTLDRRAASTWPQLCFHRHRAAGGIMLHWQWTSLLSQVSLLPTLGTMCLSRIQMLNASLRVLARIHLTSISFRFS